MAKFQISGVVQADAEVKTSKKGKQWAEMLLTESPGTKWEKHYPLKGFENVIDIMCSIPLHRKIYIVGNLSAREWEGKFYVDLIFEGFQELKTREGGSPPPDTQPPPEDDVPF